MSSQFPDLRDVAVSAGMDKLENTNEERSRAMRVICGSRACIDAEDARKVLEPLGLIQPKDENVDNTG